MRFYNYNNDDMKKFKYEVSVLVCTYNPNVNKLIRTLATLFNKYKFYDNQIYLLYGLSIVIICIESFTNPFMNNAIGIMFYCICCGIAYGDADAKLKSIDDNAIKRC